MTLNGVMAIFGVISATSVAFSAHCVKVVEDMPKRSVKKYSPKFLVFSDVLLMAIFAVDDPQRGR